MTAQAIPMRQNSTTVRSPSFLRVAVKATSALSPRLTDSITLRLFGTTRRTKAPPVPEVEGLSAASFSIPTSVGHLAAWSWGEGPVVLLVHGWEGHSAQLTPFVAPLVAEGFRVVVFDMPAHGRSGGRFTHVMHMSQAVREVAAALGSVHAVIAHSLGGAATVIALKRGLETERVALLAPVAEPTPFARKLAEYLELSPARTEGLLKRIQKVLGGDIPSMDGRVIARSMRIPALVFHDPADREVPYEHGEGIAYWWPRAQFVELQGLGHRRLLKDPAVVRRTVEFVRKPSQQTNNAKSA